MRDPREARPAGAAYPWAALAFALCGFAPRGALAQQQAAEAPPTEEDAAIRTWGIGTSTETPQAAPPATGGPDESESTPAPNQPPRKQRKQRKQRKKKPLPAAPQVSTSPEHLGATGAPDVKAAKKPEEESNGHIIVPLVLYSPETHLGLGGFYVYHFRLREEPIETRTSSLSFIAIATTRKQLILEFLPDFYWDHEAWHVKGKLEFQKFPDSFWGIGPRTPWSAEERYDRTRMRFRGGGLRRAVSAVYAGLYTDVMYFTADYPDPDGTFATEDVPGEPGGMTVGIGPHVTYDTRDNALSAHRGTYIDVKLLSFPRWLGSDYRFGQGIVDARQFVPLAENQTLALRLFGQMEYGDPPYYQLSMLGGDDLVRGYFLGRYRDRQLIAVEAEYRYPLFWLFSGVAFMGAAEVEPRVTDFNLDPVRWAGGGGLRLLLNRQERLNLRFDVGAGPHTWGAYLSATEAF